MNWNYENYWKVMDGYFEEPCYFVCRLKNPDEPLQYGNMEIAEEIYGSKEEAQAAADKLNTKTEAYKKRASAAFDAMTSQCQRDAVIWLEGMAAANMAKGAKVEGNSVEAHRVAVKKRKCR